MPRRLTLASLVALLFFVAAVPRASADAFAD